MKRVLIIDRNWALIEKVRAAITALPPTLSVEAKVGDIFEEEGVIVSASNPAFSMGGGLDAQIRRRFPDLCAQVDASKGNQRIESIVFAVTVGEDYRATPELVASALSFALSSLKDGERLLVSGLGTGIGGLREDEFVRLLLAALSTWDSTSPS